MSPAHAGDKYYTWVDAEGRIHNSPVESPDAPHSDKNADESADKKAVTSPGASTPAATDEFLTEEQLEEKLRRYDEDNPAFYLWVDPQGGVHTQTYDADEEQEAAASDVSGDTGAIIGWDTMLAPPFRVPAEVAQSPCCEAFKSEFEKARKPLRSVQLFDPVRYRSFVTEQGNRPAWYVDIGRAAKDSSGQRFLVLRVRGASVKSSLLVLNDSFKPLYFEKTLYATEHPETWHGVAYQEMKILIEDADVSAFILYPDLKPAEELSLEVRWADGVPPF